MKSAPAIVFDYRPSRWLIAAVVVVTVVALSAVMFCAMPPWAKVVAAMLACAYAVLSVRWFQRSSVAHAAWYAAGHWRLIDGAGIEHLAELQSGIVRGSWIVLRLRGNASRHAALILGPDNSDAELRRHLRVRLARAREEAV